MDEFFEYFGEVLHAIQLGLTLKLDGVHLLQNDPHANWIALGVVMTAGISLLLGQSVILFLNRITPLRFLLSLFANGLLLAVGWVIWSTAVWGVGSLLFAEKPSYLLVLRVIALSYAPLALDFLTLMPYMGRFVHRLLYVWTFLLALRAVMYTFQVTVWQALLCVGIGWLILVLLTATVGRPLVGLQNWLWHRITGTHADPSTRQLPTPFPINKVTSQPPQTVSQSGPEREKP